MAVKVVDKKTGAVSTGKFASLKGNQVSLFSGIMSDKKGGFRGCGKCTRFSLEEVTLTADDPQREIKK